MVKLFADEDYWSVSEKIRANWGCGPGGIGDVLVPDTVWGLNIKPACQIHDWYYRHWPEDTEEARLRADRIFFNNMLRIVNAKTKNRLLLALRRLRCKTYYKMVRSFGATAYFMDRNLENTYQEVKI
jgi:hypothetical protein